jgi:DNA-binding transcriptional ArsR family regulator
MAKLYDDSLSLTFGALTDPTRRTIVSLLRERPRSVSELAEHLPFNLPGITKHLDVLARAELVDRSKSGRVVSVTLSPAPLKAAHRWLERYDAFWTGSLDKLQRRLERDR